VFQPRQRRKLAWGTEDKEHAMSHLNSGIAVIGIDIGKNSFHLVGQDRRGAIVLRQKWSRGQVEARLANLSPCLVGMEACVGAHHLSRKLQLLGHNARLMPAKYVRPYSKGQKNDFRDAETCRRSQSSRSRLHWASAICRGPFASLTCRKRHFEAGLTVAAATARSC
jgi:transposase